MNKQTLTTLIVGLLLGVTATLTVTAATNKDELAPQTSNTTVSHNTQTTDKLKALRNDEFDKAFIEEMIKHHQSAIEMANLIPANSKHEELKTLGQDIISAQSKEIDMMQTWQNDWGYKASPQSHNMQDM